MPAELAKLDAESAKRRNRRAAHNHKNTAAMLEAAQHKANADEKEAIVNKAYAMLMLGGSFLATPVGLASTSSSVARPPQCPSSDIGVIASSTPRPSAVINLNVTPGSSSGLRLSVEMQRKQARPPSTAIMSLPHVLFGEMTTPTPTVEDSLYNHFMENVIYEGPCEAFQMGGDVNAFDPEETQSQDGGDQYVVDEYSESDDHGDSWHQDDDIYCEGEGDEEKEGIDIVDEPLFIDELTQRAEAQKRKKGIHTRSY
ncbi:Serine/threonine-protein kinase mph1 [Hordeum vulgare]|nr:Serine/threonine-protein kinase mph1 [Hordeum vulgare]